MNRAPETLTRLVSERVGEGRPLTFRAFESRAVDPVTGYKPSRTTIWKIAKGGTVQLSPELVRAVAAGADLDPQRAAAAAAYQYAGYVSSSVEGGVVVHRSDVRPEDASLGRDVVARWNAEEESGQPSDD